MLDEYGFEEYEKNEIPLAYLITIRTLEPGFMVTRGTPLLDTEETSVDATTCGGRPLL